MRSFELSPAELRARAGIKWHLHPEDVLPAWIAEMDFEVAEPIQAALRRLVDERSYGYEGPGPYQALAESFAAYMRRRYGWLADSDRVVPVADLVQAQFAAVQAFAGPGQGVVLQTPIYPPFIHAVQEMGRRVVEHRLVDNGARFELDGEAARDIFDASTPLLLLCNPHNPTGRVFERAELEAIASVVLERRMVVLADEVHADLVYAGRRHIPFASLAPEIAERTVTITSATKAYNIPGLRCGVMHFGSAALLDQFRSVFPERLLGRVNGFGIEATLAAWADCSPWLECVMQVLEANRQRLEDFVVSSLPGLRLYPPEATYLAWIDCRQLDLETSPQQFFLERARVGLNDGADFGAPGRGHVRLNFGTSAAILEDILGRMAEAVRGIRS
ncbi:MAG TPA: PatB family C-S lyase [Chloroflexota bacterium]